MSDKDFSPEPEDQDFSPEPEDQDFSPEPEDYSSDLNDEEKVISGLLSEFNLDRKINQVQELEPEIDPEIEENIYSRSNSPDFDVDNLSPISVKEEVKNPMPLKAQKYIKKVLKKRPEKEAKIDKPFDEDIDDIIDEVIPKLGEDSEDGEGIQIGENSDIDEDDGREIKEERKEIICPEGTKKLEKRVFDPFLQGWRYCTLTKEQKKVRRKYYEQHPEEKPIKKIPREILEQKCAPHQFINENNRCQNRPDYEEEKKKKRRKRLEPELNEEKKLWVMENEMKEQCVLRSKLPLRDIQIKPVAYLETHDSLLLVHGTGCGKTLTAIAAAECFLDKNPQSSVMFLGPLSLINNFKKELKAYGVSSFHRKKYTFYSFNAYLKNTLKHKEEKMDGKFIIIDEVHNLRNPTGKRYLAILRNITTSAKRLIMTATPFFNYVSDIIPLINLLYGKFLVGTREQFYNFVSQDIIGNKLTKKNIEKIKYYLYGKVDVQNCYNEIDFPRKKEYIIPVEMGEAFTKDYSKLICENKDYYKVIEEFFQPFLEGENVTEFDIDFENPKAFYNGHRRAVNKVSTEYFTEKIKSLLPVFRLGKAVIYSNWLEFGLEPITSVLRKNGITFRSFYGRVTTVKRKQYVEKFNKGEIDVLIITSAGGEGINLLESKSITILDPPWHYSGLQQIIGRTVRYHSHINLPEEEREVKVFLPVAKVKEELVNCNPVQTLSNRRGFTGDEILYDIIREKQLLGDKIDEILSRLSI